MLNYRCRRIRCRLLKAAVQLVHRVTKRWITALLRSLLLIGRSPVAGFVLPTTMMLLLLVSLAIAAVSLRAYDRTEQVVGDRRQRIVYNAATPAIDRAKAKLEFLFAQDPRFPSGIPGETILEDLLSDGTGLLPGGSDAYQFPDETWLDLDQNGTRDTAWSYRTDIDSDGIADATVAYSLILRTPAVIDPFPMTDASDAAVAGRANRLQVRHGPLSGANQLSNTCQVGDGADGVALVEEGWFEDRASSAILRKNFQVDVYVLPDGLDGAVSTLEFHQDRLLSRGNKWGAWFRNDLEIFPGPQFNWNGAMHTEGNLVIGNQRFNGYLVSAPASCLYSRPDASEVTVTDVRPNPDDDIPAFQGQIISGKINSNSFGSTSSDRSHFHLFGNPPVITGDDDTLLNLERDSVIDGANDPRPADYALDPIALVTRDVSLSRNIPTGNPKANRDTAVWNSAKPFVKRGRIYNQSEDAPYLDDFFRADNRYGPKPRYQAKPIPGMIGEPIISERMATENISDAELIRNEAPADSVDYGFDGYWERRSQREGMRLIVGQRLDLGNGSGWGTDGNGDGDLDDAGERNDPLYPADSCPGSRCHETLQRRALRDNLAAVQAMAIYHQGRPVPLTAAEQGGDFPIACFALTAHPGTLATIRNSRTFATKTVGGTNYLDINFFTGQGTNGWEFAPPAASDALFEGAIAPNQPLGKALRNLAHFAGDPEGGAPSFPPVQEASSSNIVHPYPHLTMWGDYSALRRVLAMLDGGSYGAGNPFGNPAQPNDGATQEVNYLDDSTVDTDIVLSPADRSTLHTAACTLGMLGYTLSLLEAEYDQALSGLASLQSFGVKMSQLLDGVCSTGNKELVAEAQSNCHPLINTATWVDPNPDSEVPDITDPSNPLCTASLDDVGFDAGCDEPEIYRELDADDILDFMGLTQAEKDDFKATIALLTAGSQAMRDRTFGFAEGYPIPPIGTANGVTWNPQSGFTEPKKVGGNNNAVLQTACDPDIFANYTGQGGGGGSNQQARMGLALVACSEARIPKYPSLYYLFPLIDHDHDGGDNTGGTLGIDHTQPAAEAYIADTHIFDAGAGVGVNDGYTYRVLDDGDGDGLEESGDDSMGAIALQPRGTAFASDWTLPTTGGGVNEIYGADGSVWRSLPFLDKGIYNGREMMAVRVLDLDLNLMRTRTDNLGQNLDGTGDDHWLPDSGIVYGFREDAVREDAILRPLGSGADWTICGRNAVFEQTSHPDNSRCRMEANPASLQDPPLNETNRISPKSVDYYPDPDRRPHGFRLRDGERVDRPNSVRGISLVSDNPVYMHGSFNLHQTSGGTRLEEFQTNLNNSYNNFYSRNNLDPRFSRPSQDRWRPSEILADAVTVISDDFCDGSIEDTFRTVGAGSGAQISSTLSQDYGCNDNERRTSYLNQNRPDDSDLSLSDFAREDPDNPAAPVLISRNGHPMLTDGSEYPSTDYYDFNDDKSLIRAENERVNTIIISGLVPSRNDQSYGGMHNFPRFISRWNTLHISGALLQLNFSNYATAPFDQDAWETNQNTANPELIEYYGAPNRRWGYDVGLQYAPAGPIAQRFVSSESIRSEFYSEPAADDPYMVNLCRAIAPTPDTDCGA